MMESALEMEFLHRYLAEEWVVAGYSVEGNVHHVLLRSHKELRALSFRTEDPNGDGQADVTGFEESTFII